MTYLISAAAHLLVACLLLLSRAQHRYKALLLGATILMHAWSVAVAIEAAGTGGETWRISTVVAALEQIRTLGWLTVVGYVLFVAYRKVIDTMVAATYLGVISAAMGVAVWQTRVINAGDAGPLNVQGALIASMLVAICSLVMVENLFRNVGREARWAVKYVCVALAAVFGYDLVLYAEALLFGRLNPGLFAARGIIDAMIAPLIVIAGARSKTWPIDLHVSRRLAFHSATVLVSGAYMIGMGALGYYLRLLDSEWGIVARIGFIAAAVLALALALSSASFQARIRGFINSNFFSYKYDYRREWPRFIATISDNPTESTIPFRILRALANILECTAGGLWLHVDEDDTYRLAETWNVTNLPPNVGRNEPFVLAMAGHHDVIDLHAPPKPGAELPVAIPAWLANDSRLDLVVPLAHPTGLLGFVALGRLRAPRALDHEDYELLGTAGRQAASYLAEDQAGRLLARARRFEDFNRQFAFVVHDIKNLAGQMSLILKNAERYGDNPEFQKDVLATVADSLKRMQSLLDQINQRRRASAAPARVDLAAIARRLGAQWSLQLPKLAIAIPNAPVEIVGDDSRIEAILNHLVHNAHEATGAEGRVRVALRTNEMERLPRDERWAILEVEDDGPGMDSKFIEEKLFQPLATTKSSGYGIGAYQALFLIKEIGGKLDVDSEVGRGTRMIVRFPLAPDAGSSIADVGSPVLQRLS